MLLKGNKIERKITVVLPTLRFITIESFRFFAFVKKKTYLTFILVLRMKNFYRSETFCFDFKKYSGVQQMLSFAL
jgi:hypothetical protein